MLTVPGSRVVTVSSNAHRTGRIDFTDLNWQRRRYRRLASYAQSKLANLMFTDELQRRLVAAGAATAALAAHPGTATTQLTRHFPGVLHSLNQALGNLYGQSAEMGALPLLRAATDPAARGGEFYGPGGLWQMMGYPKRVEPARRSHDIAVQQRLWAESIRLTGLEFPV
jgi:NAD(P)-dependent dehydrogenase (short-subunit alcohol dehydrogenase family)